MKLTVTIHDLKLRHTFTIARSSADVTPVVIVKIEHDGVTGYGEASPSAFYGDTAESVRDELEAIAPWVATHDPNEYRLLLLHAADRLKNPAALCALDLAMHDWVGKRIGVPVYRLFGLSGHNLPPTSYTIGIDSIVTMIAKLEEMKGFPIYKIKLGTDRDIEIVEALREKTDAVFRVDANCAWDVKETIEKSRVLAALGVEFIEQPLAPDRLDAMAEVYAQSALPIVAAENSIGPKDVPKLTGRFHGVNIKLVKCGGLQPAMEMIALARSHGLKVMIGCMIESSNACTAAAHLGSLVDYLDIDGPLLIENDPFEGMKIGRGRISLTDAPGLGVTMKTKRTGGRRRTS